MPIIADRPTLFRKDLIAKKQAFHVVAGQRASLTVYLRNTEGSPVSIADLADVPEGRALVYESIAGPRRAVAADCDIISGAAGELEVTLPATATARNGIYSVDCGIFDEEEQLLASNNCSLFVERSGWGDATAAANMPSLQEVRHSVQQSDLLENLLREEWIYDLADICNAMTRAVQFWNEQLPVIRAATYTTCTFPHPSTWLTGVQLFMFQAAEEWYRRNKLPYNAGGTATDDLNRDADYKRAWQERLELYKTAVMEHKARININRGYASFSGFSMGSW